MGLHKPFDRAFHVIGGATMTNGNSLNLAKGQIGIFDMQKTSVNGAQAVSSFAGKPKSDYFYEIKMGTTDLNVTRSQTNKSWSTFPFALNNVVKLGVSAPELTEQSVDEVIVGYNGIDDATAITFKKGDIKKLNVELKGEPIQMLGYGAEGVVIPVYMESEQCDPLENCVDCDPCASEECLPLVLEAIETLKNHQLRGGTKVSDYVEVVPVKSCDTLPAETTIGYTFYQLEVCDTGDQQALALVQAQYPTVKVERTGRNGATSTYQFMQPTADAAPADYQQSVPSIIKGCEDCPAGYTEAAGGFIYAVTLEDDGADSSATVETLANAVAASAVKGDGQNDGVGYYTVVLTEELSDADFDTFIAANPTATIDLVGKVDAICDNSTTTDTAWTTNGTCEISQHTYTIELPDTVCGEARLQELRDAFPSLEVYMGDGNASIDVTLTGTSGTATITINGNNYTVTFNADLTTTASDFVTAEAANILAAEGLTVTANAGVLTFTGAYADVEVGVAIANATGDLAGTVADIAYANVVSGGCQTQYSAVVNTSMRCDDCDPIFDDYFSSEAPERYDTREWTLVEGAAATNCLCGIKIKGKVLEVHPDECLRDEIGFVDSSVLVRASGGYVTEVREGIGQTDDNSFNVEYKSRWKRRTHMGGNFFNDEDRNRVFFSGEARHYGDNVAKLLKGEESHLESDKQYVDYALTLRRDTYSQSFGGRGEDNITYHIRVEVGRHQAVESLLNNLASAAGIKGVQAFGA